MEKLTKTGTQAHSAPLLVTTIATLAALAWGPSWMPFAVLALGTAWFGASKPHYPKAGAGVLVGLLVLAIVSSGYGVGRDMALRDNARAPAAR